MVALPAQVQDEFALSWNGSDAGGIRYFDIFASTDGSPFTLWKSATTDTAALYKGVPGSSYAFYSVATDTAGNREVKTVADAQTSVTGTNTAPIISPLNPVQLVEGQALDLNISATDSDGPLAFSLEGVAPNGMTLTNDGDLHWITGEGDGGKSFTVTIAVTDNGLPRRTSTADLTITVHEGNQAPKIIEEDVISLRSGETVLRLLKAIDPDAPAQSFTWAVV